MNADDEEIKSLYYGSNEYLVEMRAHIDALLEHRKLFKYELFFRICYESDTNTTPIVKTSTYLSDLTQLKANPKQLMRYSEPCHEYKVFLRRLSDNYTVMLGKKSKNTLIELTENFFKLKD